MKNLLKVMKEYGVSTSEACNAISNLPQMPFTEYDIMLINSNPSLNCIQKNRLSRFFKKNMHMK